MTVSRVWPGNMVIRIAICSSDGGLDDVPASGARPASVPMYSCAQWLNIHTLVIVGLLLRWSKTYPHCTIHASTILSCTPRLSAVSNA